MTIDTLKDRWLQARSRVYQNAGMSFRDAWAKAVAEWNEQEELANVTVRGVLKMWRAFASE